MEPGVYRSRPAISPDLRRTIDHQRHTINDLRQQLDDLTQRITDSETDEGADRRHLAAELHMLERQLLSYADDLKALYHTVRYQGRRLRATAQDVVKVLVSAMEARDARAAKHARYVAVVAEALGRRLALDETAIQTLRLGGLLHVVGNVVLDRGLAARDTPLSREEWEKVREHPAAGAALIADLPSLAPAVAAVRHHHERWDGKGYPDGLRGEAIPLEARILAVAEVFCGLVAPSSSRSGLATQQALEQLRLGADSQFDRRCVDGLVAACAAGEVPLGEAGSPPRQGGRS